MPDGAPAERALQLAASGRRTKIGMHDHPHQWIDELHERSGLVFEQAGVDDRQRTTHDGLGSDGRKRTLLPGFRAALSTAAVSRSRTAFGASKTSAPALGVSTTHKRATSGSSRTTRATR